MAINNSHHTNALINESSPYLLEHVHNPVNWHPWGQDALDKAKAENKLIIISIGYAACHWCHVMMHESFEDEAVARVMNEHYIAIKVDREERPDIDQVYMNAVQLLTGSGGWPLNAIALPDGRPIFGGTYFRKEQWIEVLTNVAAYAKEHPEKTEEVANSLTEGVRSSDLITVKAEVQPVTMEDLAIIYSNWKTSFDVTNGGYTGAPKFPLPIGYQFLLMYHYLTGDSSAMNAITTTLDAMADGGIYDQIGGGFARYSVDAYWQVPHFEKMLYDNSQLVSLYVAAYQSTKKSTYKNIVYETLGFVERELTSEEGGFYSSLDADSEGEEGTFYVWTKQELTKLLGNDAPIINEYYSITESGNWEDGKNTLFKLIADEELADKYTIPVAELLKKVDAANKVLFEERSKRIYPRTDDKIIAGWNALMLKAYAEAYKAMGDEKFLEIAIRNARFILHKMHSVEGNLFRTYKNGNATVNAFLDDYAFFIDALIALYQVTFDESWLKEAKLLTEYVLQHFYDVETGMFFYTSNLDAALIARKMEVTDNVTPASNSVMAKNLFMVGTYYSIDDYLIKSEKMMTAIKEQAFGAGPYYANWDILMAWFESQPYEVAIVGDNYNVILQEFNQHYLPNVFFSGGEGSNASALLEGKGIAGQTTIYVCRNKVCKLPVTTVKEALAQLRTK